MFERLLLTVGLILLGIAAYVVLRQMHLRRASRVAAAAGKPAILYFRSDTCAPCKAQGRGLADARKLAGQLRSLGALLTS